MQLVCGSARFSLLTLPVEEYPTLPEMPSLTGTLPGARLAAAVAAGGGRRRPRRHAAGAHRDPDRARRRQGDAGGHRPLPPRGARARRGRRSRPAWSRWPWCRPGRWPTRPSRSRRCESVAVALARSSVGRGPGRLRRRRPADHHPAARGRVPQVPLAAADRVGERRGRRHRRARRGGQAGRAGRRAQHPGPAELHRPASCSSTPGPATRRRRPRRSACSLEGEPLTIAFNPQFLLDGLGAVDSAVSRLSFTTSSKPAVLTGGSAEGGDAG